MQHLPFVETPITPLPYFSQKLGVELWCKRDDLFTEAGGGNKARMLQYILAGVSPLSADVVLTAGGPSSNFNRACALMCAKLGVPMHLIEYTDEAHEFDTSLNYFLCRLSGVRTTRCDKKNVAETIETVRQNYCRQGQRVKFIYGGGKSIEGVYAYYEAIRELHAQLPHVDDLYVACGTGTTLTGICAGMQRYYPHATVHAISTARLYAQEEGVLKEDMQMLNAYLGTQYSFANLKFTEDFLCGGYGEYTQGLLDAIRESATHEGMLIDPTYSGKAFWGMCEQIARAGDSCGKRILFWNTGGVMNLLSAARHGIYPQNTDL